MKFIMQLPNGSFHVPSAALKISGLEGGDRIEAGWRARGMDLRFRR